MTPNQRPSQTSAFWQSEFQVSAQAVEALYSALLEFGEPRSIEDVGLFFVKQVIDAEEQALKAELQQGEVYRPDQIYNVGDKLVFTRFDLAVGVVVETTPGYNPIDKEFSIIRVEFPQNRILSFAANLQSHHELSVIPSHLADGEDGLSAAQKIFGQYQHLIRPKIEAVLRRHSEFVEFNRQWFLSDLLVDVQEGLLNIVDAAIDINAGPLNVDALIEQLELQKNGAITEALRFSVNYRLKNDLRFINVGTEETVLWYLNRLKPYQVDAVPRNLKIRPELATFNPAQLSDEMREELREIDDESTPVEYARPVDLNADEVTFALSYPHWRAGTIPVLPSIRYLLPDMGNQLLALQLIDGQRGDTILAWLVNKHNYIFGIEPWLNRHKLPVGVFISLKKTDNPLKFIINFTPQRTQREWVRIATAKNNQFTFELKNRSLPCKRDELIALEEENPEAIDLLWNKFEENQISLFDLIVRVFPELVKLTSQGMVHSKTLYSAINVVRRCPPGPLLYELASHPCFIWMDHGYWSYRP